MGNTTHTSAEQERAEFEAAYLAEKMRLTGLNEEQARKWFLGRDDEEYTSGEAAGAWWAWQAASRTQVLPRTLSDEFRNCLKRCRNAFPTPASGTDLERLWLLALDDVTYVPDYIEALAAAPQPPQSDMGIPITQPNQQLAEATPVHLPKPDAYVLIRVGTVEATGTALMECKSAYFPETVCQLLAQSNLVESRRIKEPAPSADHIPDVGKMVAKETPFTAVKAAVNKNLEVYRRVISKRAAPKTPPAA